MKCPGLMSQTFKGYPVVALHAEICLTGYEDHKGRQIGSLTAYVAQTGIARRKGISF